MNQPLPTTPPKFKYEFTPSQRDAFQKHCRLIVDNRDPKEVLRMAIAAGERK